MIQSIFSRISLSRWSDLSEGKDAVLFELMPQPFLLNRLCDEIDAACEDRLQPLTQAIDPAEIGKTPVACFLCQVNNYIDIGIRAVIAARGRADQGQAGNPPLLH